MELQEILEIAKEHLEEQGAAMAIKNDGEISVVIFRDEHAKKITNKILSILSKMLTIYHNQN